jgi:hypothetical protein
MAINSAYESVAGLFRDEHSNGALVSGSALQKWTADNANGSALTADLGITDPRKRINTLRRHLNQGGASDAFDAERRFYLAIEDRDRMIFVVQSYTEHAMGKATGAIERSVAGALNPLSQGEKFINSLKLDELPEIDRKAAEMARENLRSMTRTIKPSYAREVDRIWIAEMERRGISAEHAMKIREALPQVTRLQKLLKKTA